MITEQIYISNSGQGMDEALALAEHFCDYHQIGGKNRMHLRLLSEEAIGLLRAITGDYKALYWLEGSANACRIMLELRTEMDSAKRKELLALSTSGQNEAARGIMGKIREIIEIGILGYQEADQMVLEAGGDPYGYWAMGIDSLNAMSQNVLTWSLRSYRTHVDEWKESGNAPEEVWDELEKSIVAKLADDVRIGIRSDSVTMSVLKNFA